MVVVLYQTFTEDNIRRSSR